MIRSARVAGRFHRVAKTYAEHDFFVREIDRRLLERMDLVRLQPRRILDLGCARSGSAEGLAQRYKGAQIIAVDNVFAMLHETGAQEKGWYRRFLPVFRDSPVVPLLADASALPIKNAIIDLTWSNFLLHWLPEPTQCVHEVYRVLSVGGLFSFSALGPDTFKELRELFPKHAVVNRFVDMHDYGDMLLQAGFSDPVVDMEIVTLTYERFPDLCRDLQGSGSRYVMQDGGRQGLMSKSALKEAESRFDVLKQDGRFSLTLEVIYGHAWKEAPKNLSDGRQIIRFSPKPVGVGRL